MLRCANAVCVAFLEKEIWCATSVCVRTICGLADQQLLLFWKAYSLPIQNGMPSNFQNLNRRSMIRLYSIQAVFCLKFIARRGLPWSTLVTSQKLSPFNFQHSTKNIQLSTTRHQIVLRHLPSFFTQFFGSVACTSPLHMPYGSAQQSRTRLVSTSWSKLCWRHWYVLLKIFVYSWSSRLSELVISWNVLRFNDACPCNAAVQAQKWHQLSKTSLHWAGGVYKLQIRNYPMRCLPSFATGI